LPSGRWIAISTGAAHTCAQSDAGTIACWGNNIDGALGDGSQHSPGPAIVDGLAAPVANVVAANDFSCALLADGGVKCWGVNVSLAASPWLGAEFGADWSADSPDVNVPKAWPEVDLGTHR